MASAQLAEWHFQGGQAVRAACCHLAVDDVEVCWGCGGDRCTYEVFKN